jgi:ribonuclease HI
VLGKRGPDLLQCDGLAGETMAEAPQRSLPRVTIYTDGGADPNPGPGGWGAVLVHPASGRTEEQSGGEPHTTNNRMELTAAIRALEALNQPCRVELHTDSQYLRRGVSEWLPGWIARGWRRKSGELQNEDLWRRLAAAEARHEVTWKWLKGHAGHPQNERADQLASAAIGEQRAAARSAAAGGHGGGGGAAARTVPPPPDFEVFLRVSQTPRGSGWAALIRRGAPTPEGEDGGTRGAGERGERGVGEGGERRAEASAKSAADRVGAELSVEHGGRTLAQGESDTVHEDGERVLTGGLPPGAAATSNALDLAAAVAALESLPAGASVVVHTISDYLRLGASRWLPAWRQRGWKTQEGTPVLNRGLWQRLAAALATRRVSWPDVRGRDLPELDRLAPLAKAAAAVGGAHRG